MKYNYQYRTKDNSLHKGVVSATDKDAAYALLKSKGIRPSRLEEASGFFNKLFGKGKRWIAITVLSVVVVALSFVIKTRPVIVEQSEPSRQRHQIYGDPAIIEEMRSGFFANVFSNDGERYLAAYAMPGATMPEGALRLKSPEILKAALTNTIVISESDSREIAELKAIVNGMKDELREYLADGEGTCSMFIRRLEERQEEERLIYRRVQNELETNPDPKLWEERNKALRDMGIRTIPRLRSKAN